MNQSTQTKEEIASQLSPNATSSDNQEVISTDAKQVKSPSFQSPRGTRDILPENQKYWQLARSKAEDIARFFGFERIDIPVFELANLFNRSIGSETDIISKELFLLSTSKDEQSEVENLLALRPEFTAGIVRAYIQNGMQSLPQPVKLFSIGQVFRHEKPQKGRFRDPYQFDLEIIGDANPKADAWTILAAWHYLKNLGLQGIEVQINSLGNANSQKNYLKKLKDYYTPLEPRLCSTCQVRLKSNPLRLLDCKESNCIKFKNEAPQTIDNLDDPSRDHFMAVLSLLDSFGVAYNLNPYIVRGLDYYTHTAFEIMIAEHDPAKELSGARHQLAIGGGGRYDYLVEQLGGNPTPGVGLALGLDRIIEEMKQQNVQVDHPAKTEIFITGIGPKAMERTRDVVLDLLSNGLAAEFSPDKNSISAQLKVADKLGVHFTVIIGEKEAKDGTCIIRDMKSGIQEDAKLDELVSILKERLR